MSASPFRFMHQISVLAKPILIFILVLFFSVSNAQKTNATKPDEAYTQAIKNGDKLLQAGDFLHALNEFEKALMLSPSQTYPQEKIAQIEKTLSDSQLSNSLFEASITNGEKYSAAKDYKNAKTEYLNAMRLDPEAQYPKDRLAEISKVFIDPEDEALYNSAIKSAAVALGKKEYDEAIGFYKQALVIKPGNKELKTLIADANRLKSELAAQKDIYNKSIVTADKLLEQKKYAEARAEYTKALAIIPGENYPSGKIASIDQLLAANKASDDAYAAIIDGADKFYVARDFDNARIRYQQALNMRPGERYPKSMLEKADMGQTEVRTIQQRYDAAIANADNLFKAAEMDAALIGYQSASIILPNESYPKTKIAEIKKIVSDRNSRQDAYNIAISNGDQAFDIASYPKALAEYKNALSLQPGEDYPKTRIAAIEALVLKEKGSQDSYNIAIANADRDFGMKKYSGAVTGYQTALALKPAEKYPQDKITEINSILDKQKSLQGNYDKAITDADKSFGEKNYSVALIDYQTALGLKPSETYPKDKISKINTLLGQQKALQDNYEKTIINGDKELGEKNYPLALTSFQSALAIKPAEKYPQEKITEINGILTKQKSLQENYDKAIIAADKDLAEKKYPEALNGYQSALALLPAETYPQGKINEINGMLGQQKDLQNNYDKTIAAADKSFGGKDYPLALTGFRAALAIKPAEKYPQEKITEINTILLRQKEILDNYEKAITAADNDFGTQKYPEAITGYKSALAIKPTEKYPQDKITEINGILANQKSVQENYDKAIIDADKSFSEKNYSLALSAYQIAIGLKPAETYAKGKTAEINSIMGQEKALQDSYDKAIADADKSLGKKDYTEATTGYKSALLIKPNQSYPQEKITEIAGSLVKQNALNESYSKAIANADKAFGEKDYSLALTGYQSALSLKPEETYPQEKINAINAAFADDKEKTDQRYAELISKADADYSKQDYTNARISYQQAASMKPGEVYPKDKLTEIANFLLARTKEMKDNYDRIIVDADKAYAARIFDQAIDFYENAITAKPDESYPGEMIAKIQKYMAEHSIVNVTKETFMVLNNTEKRYFFKSIDASLRKNNYVVLKARNPSGTKPKVYLNYGRDNAKNGGIVLRSITNDVNNDFIIRISVQDKWYREDNNWLSLYSEGGDIEVSSVQIAQGD